MYSYVILKEEGRGRQQGEPLFAKKLFLYWEAVVEAHIVVDTAARQHHDKERRKRLGKQSYVRGSDGFGRLPAGTRLGARGASVHQGGSAWATTHSGPHAGAPPQRGELLQATPGATHGKGTAPGVTPAA